MKRNFKRANELAALLIEYFGINEIKRVFNDINGLIKDILENGIDKYIYEYKFIFINNDDLDFLERIKKI